MASQLMRASSPENGIRVRQATENDIFFIESLIREAADNSSIRVYEQPTIQQLLADLFESKPSWCGVLVAERGSAALGAATFRRSYWSWSGRTLVLAGLYVRPPARRQGLGRCLVLELCRLALAEHAQLDWLHPRDPTALAFFAQFGAHENNTFNGLRTMKMPIDSITLAANGPSGSDDASRFSERRDISDDGHTQSPSANQMVTVRPARPDDMVAINDMINELAVYQEEPEGPKLTVKGVNKLRGGRFRLITVVFRFRGGAWRRCGRHGDGQSQLGRHPEALSTKPVRATERSSLRRRRSTNQGVLQVFTSAKSGVH